VSIELDAVGIGEEARHSSSSATPGRSSSVWEYDQRLSHLNLSCSTRLEHYLDGSEVPESGSMPSEASPVPGEPESWSDPSLGNLLRDMSKFLAIIQSYTPGESVRPRLGTVIHLNILSVYLQLVATSDKLIQCLCCQFGRPESLSQRPTVSGAEGPQPLPGLQLAGFHVQQGTLQASLLLHTVLHQFSMMERFLGLPTEWRVVGKRESRPVGLLEDEQARLLLEAVSTGSMGRTGGYLPAVASLRDGIIMFQKYIDR
jgi:hypothetical protein